MHNNLIVDRPQCLNQPSTQNFDSVTSRLKAKLRQGFELIDQAKIFLRA
ncbi:hypothetical protein QUB08_15090 [Microcoleus sp. BR0-C5]